MLKLHNSIEDARFVVQAASQTLDKAIHRVQRACEHTHIAESAGSPPTRICLNCGMTELGWGPGYQVLNDNGEMTPPGISLDRLYEMRAGLVITDHLKTPIIRGEKTVADLVDEHFLPAPTDESPKSRRMRR